MEDKNIYSYDYKEPLFLVVCKFHEMAHFANPNAQDCSN